MVNRFVFGKCRCLFCYVFFIAFTSVPVFGQTRKRDLVVSPQVYFWKGMLKSNQNFNSQYFGIGSSVHYYLSNRFAIGVLFNGKYWNFDAKVASSFDRRTFECSVMPELQYNILKSRLTPFLKTQMQFITIGSRWQRNDDPTKPLRQRKVNTLLIERQWPPLYAIGVSAGISYSIRDNSSVFLSLNRYSLANFSISSIQIGLGCQFVLNRKK